MIDSNTPTRNSQPKKISDRSQLYSIRLACENEISLSELESAGISYVPCTHQSPLFKFAPLWDLKVQVKLDSYKDAHGWTMSQMRGVQIMTGRPTYRSDEHSPDGYQYLSLLDIEARFIERYPDEFGTIESLLKESCPSEPCIIESKSGGQHFYFFCDYLAPKISFKDRTDGATTDALSISHSHIAKPQRTATRTAKQSNFSNRTAACSDDATTVILAGMSKPRPESIRSSPRALSHPPRHGKTNKPYWRRRLILTATRC